MRQRIGLFELARRVVPVKHRAWGTVRRIASALGVEVSELVTLAEQIEQTPLGYGDDHAGSIPTLQGLVDLPVAQMVETATS